MHTQHTRASCANCDSQLIPKDQGDHAYLYCSGCNYYWKKEKLAVAHRCRVKRPEGTQVSLTYEPNQSSHGDLVLRLGQQVYRSDTYYYALDKPEGQPEDPLPSLRAMLRQWKQAAVDATSKDRIYLPYDFSDQGSVWIEGRLQREQMTLRLGWSTTEGWSFYPSSFLSDGVVPASFKPMGDSCHEMSRSDLISDIEQSIVALPKIAR